MSSSDAAGESHRRTWGNVLIVVALVMLAALVASVWASGIVRPRVAATAYSVDEVPDRSDAVEVSLQVVNRGWLPLTVERLWQPLGAGAQLENADVTTVVDARDTNEITFVLVVEDCATLQVHPHPVLPYTGHSGFVRPQGHSLNIENADEAKPSWPDATDPETASWWNQLASPICSA